MSSYRVVTLSQHTADEVRTRLRAPGYGHPAHVEVADGSGPCRLCLALFRRGEEERVLFTYNPFPEAAIPSPGPVFVHKETCPRYDGPAIPSGLLGLSLIVEGYDESGFPRMRVPIGGEPDAVVERVLAAPDVAYAHLRNAEAGCFIARIERAAS